MYEVSYGSLALSFRAAACGFDRLAEALREIGLQLALGDAYEPVVMADYESDSGESIDTLVRTEQALGVHIGTGPKDEQ